MKKMLKITMLKIKNYNSISNKKTSKTKIVIQVLTTLMVQTLNFKTTLIKEFNTRNLNVSNINYKINTTKAMITKINMIQAKKIVVAMEFNKCLSPKRSFINKTRNLRLSVLDAKKIKMLSLHALRCPYAKVSPLKLRIVWLKQHHK